MSATRLPRMELWRHDLVGCLHTSIASVLLFHGHDPTVVLGAAWDFYYPPGDARPEEYYYPCRWGSLVESLAPFHPVSSRWYVPGDPGEAWTRVRDSVTHGEPSIVAVDNYFLPFRPAYRDVHSAHLVVVYGYDDEGNQTYVLDAVPPAYKGPLSLDELDAARGSGNVVENDRDWFFAGSAIEHKILELTFGDSFPELTPEWVGGVLDDNVARFARDDDAAYAGRPGLARYARAVIERCHGGEGEDALEELFAVGGIALDSTALHAEFLYAASRRLGIEPLARLGRRVDRLAHHWTAIRIHAAKGRWAADAMAPRLETRFAALLADQDAVLAEAAAMARTLRGDTSEHARTDALPSS